MEDEKLDENILFEAQSNISLSGIILRGTKKAIFEQSSRREYSKSRSSEQIKKLLKTKQNRTKNTNTHTKHQKPPTQNINCQAKPEGQSRENFKEKNQ